MLIQQLEKEREKLANLPIQSTYVRHRKQVVERSLKLLFKTSRSQEEEEQLVSLLNELSLKQTN